MILGGDELGHTQQGNNNAYCQDNALTWLDWELDDEDRTFLEFVRTAIRIRYEQPVLQRRKWFRGRAIRGSDVKDISWFDPAGNEMSDQAWAAGFVKCLGVRLAGDAIGDVDERGEPILGETLLLLLNAHHEPIAFTLPATKPEQHWERRLDTADDRGEPPPWEPGQPYPLQDRSFAVLRVTTPAAETP